MLVIAPQAEGLECSDTSSEIPPPQGPPESVLSPVHLDVVESFGTANVTEQWQSPPPRRPRSFVVFRSSTVQRSRERNRPTERRKNSESCHLAGSRPIRFRKVYLHCLCLRSLPGKGKSHDRTWPRPMYVTSPTMRFGGVFADTDYNRHGILFCA